MSYDTAVSLMTESTSLMSSHLDFMDPDKLHCTAYGSPHADKDFEQLFFTDLNNTLTLSQLYWNKHFCAVSVDLSALQKQLFRCPDSFLQCFSDKAS